MKNKPDKQANKRTEGDWAPLAAKASEALAAAHHGETKGQIINRVAREFGVGVALLRRALAARRFIDKMRREGQKVPLDLEKAPAGIIDIVARWAAYDPAAAFDAASRYHKNQITFRELFAEELAARPQGRRVRSARMVDVIHAWKEACIAQALRQKDLQEFTFAAATVAERLPVDGWLERPGESKSKTAVRSIGPFADPNQYRSFVGQEIVIALGLCSLGHDVVLVVPGEVNAATYRNWISESGLEKTHIKIASLRRPPVLDELKRPAEQKKENKTIKNKKPG